MEETMRMAGDATGMALYCVADGETLIPILEHLKQDGSRKRSVMMMEAAEAMSEAHREISVLPEDSAGAVLVNDIILTTPEGKSDALQIDIRFAEKPEGRMLLALPYRHANQAEGFAIHRPKLIEVNGIQSEEEATLMEAFIDGIAMHKEGGKLWKEKYDDQYASPAMTRDDGLPELTPDENGTLRRSIFMVFGLVAAADGKIDKKEMEMFMKVMVNPEVLACPLMNRIVTNVIHDVPKMLASVFGEGTPDFAAELMMTRHIVESKLTEEQASTFKHALLKLGFAIASASGGFLGFGSKISKQEKKALAAIAAILGVESL